MYPITESNCDCEYENAPNPSCHENFPLTHLESLINFVETALIYLTKTEIN